MGKVPKGRKLLAAAATSIPSSEYNTLIGADVTLGVAMLVVIGLGLVLGPLCQPKQKVCGHPTQIWAIFHFSVCAERWPPNSKKYVPNVCAAHNVTNGDSWLVDIFLGLLSYLALKLISTACY